MASKNVDRQREDDLLDELMRLKAENDSLRIENDLLKLDASRDEEEDDQK